MSTAGIQRLTKMQRQDNVDRESGTEDKVNAAIERHQQHAQKSYEQALLEVEKNREAREAKGLGQLLGTIFLGPVIGTLIGGAIADLTNDGDEAAAREAKKQTGLEDMQVEKAYDDLDTAKKGLEDVRDEDQRIQKFTSEIRDSGWNSL